MAMAMAASSVSSGSRGTGGSDSPVPIESVNISVNVDHESQGTLLRRATYVRIADLVAVYNIDNARLDKEWKRVKAIQDAADGNASVGSAGEQIKNSPAVGSAEAELDGPGNTNDSNNDTGNDNDNNNTNRDHNNEHGNERDHDKAHAPRIKRLRPPSQGFNLCVKVGSMNIVADKARVDGTRIKLAEVQIGDETGIASLRARDGQIELLEEVASRSGAVVIRNCTIELFRGKFIRLAVTKWGKMRAFPDGITSTPIPPSTMNFDRDYSKLNLVAVVRKQPPNQQLLPDANDPYHMTADGQGQQSSALRLAVPGPGGRGGRRGGRREEDRFQGRIKPAGGGGGRGGHGLKHGGGRKHKSGRGHGHGHGHGQMHQMRHGHMGDRDGGSIVGGGGGDEASTSNSSQRTNATANNVVLPYSVGVIGGPPIPQPSAFHQMMHGFGSPNILGGMDSAAPAPFMFAFNPLQSAVHAHAQAQAQARAHAQAVNPNGPGGQHPQHAQMGGQQQAHQGMYVPTPTQQHQQHQHQLAMRQQFEMQLGFQHQMYQEQQQQQQQQQQHHHHEQH